MQPTVCVSTGMASGLRCIVVGLAPRRSRPLRPQQLGKLNLNPGTGTRAGVGQHATTPNMLFVHVGHLFAFLCKCVVSEDHVMFEPRALTARLFHFPSRSPFPSPDRTELIITTLSSLL